MEYVEYEILIKNTVPLLPDCFLTDRAVTHDGEFLRVWDGVFILQNYPMVC